MAIGFIGRKLGAKLVRAREDKFEKLAKELDKEYEEVLKLFPGNAKYYECFRILGISPTTNTERIKDAYRRIMRKYHPDISSSPYSQVIARKANEAYSFLVKEGGVLNIKAKQDNLVLLKQLSEEYSEMRDRDFEELKGRLSGPVERWFYIQEVNSFLDYGKRVDLVFAMHFKSFTKFCKKASSAYKLSIKASRQSGSGAGELKQYIDSIMSIIEFCKLANAEIGKMKNIILAEAKKESDEIRAKLLGNV
ncbi:MAG: J domain-containing protein [Candidatus Micrarchaeia archaeon]